MTRVDGDDSIRWLVLADNLLEEKFAQEHDVSNQLKPKSGVMYLCGVCQEPLLGRASLL